MVPWKFLWEEIMNPKSELSWHIKYVHEQRGWEDGVQVRLSKNDSLFRIWRDFKSDQRQALRLTATFIVFFYLFPAALGLCSCARPPASRCRAGSRGSVGPGAGVQGLSCPAAGVVFPDQGASSCPCVGRWTLHPWTTWGIPNLHFPGWLTCSKFIHTFRAHTTFSWMAWMWSCNLLWLTEWEL